MKAKKKKELFPQKALISIYLPKEKFWVTGEGIVDASKLTNGKFRFIAYVVLDK